MKAGFAETVITPADGRCVLAGYGPRWSTGVHDDLYASAVYLEDGDSKAVLVSFDLIAMEAKLISELKDSVQQGLNVDRDCIFFTCTHTHEGPETRRRRPESHYGEETQPDYVDEYLSFLTDKVGGVAQEAASQSRECELRVNRARVDENMNRRFFLNDEQYLFVPSHKDLVPIAHEHADKELGLVYFCPKGDTHPYGMIVNYAMHPLTAGNTSSLVSADVPGVVRDLVKESMGCLTCYITGAAGDNHPKTPEGGFAETRRVGQVLATEATNRRFDALKIEEPVRLKCLTRSVRLRFRTLEELNSIPLDPRWQGQLESYLKMVETPGAPVDVEFSLLALGPVLFVGMPGEPTSELGSMLKWFSPFKRTYVMFLATEALGYIAHPNAYVWGGYEALAGQLSPSSVRPLMDAILDAAEEISD